MKKNGESREQYLSRRKAYYEANKDKWASYAKLNRAKIAQKGKDWYLKHKDMVIARSRDWAVANPDRVREVQRHWLEINKMEVRRKQELRRKTDPRYRLMCALRNRLRMALKNHLKSGSAVRDLGCSIDEFKAYLEKLFKPGMTWSNHGYGKDKWHLDHIIPLSSFNLSNRKEFVRAVNFTNIQPLWQQENFDKNDKIV